MVAEEGVDRRNPKPYDWGGDRRPAMTVKERLHDLVEALEDADAEWALRYLSRLASSRGQDASMGALIIDEDDDIGPEDLLRLVKPITADDPLWGIVGMADSGPDGPTDVSSNKHKYLADAYADLHEDELSR
jgi:hypothetical protein